MKKSVYSSWLYYFSGYSYADRCLDILKSLNKEWHLTGIVKDNSDYYRFKSRLSTELYKEEENILFTVAYSYSDDVALSKKIYEIFKYADDGAKTAAAVLTAKYFGFSESQLAIIGSPSGQTLKKLLYFFNNPDEQALPENFDNSDIYYTGEYMIEINGKWKSAYRSDYAHLVLSDTNQEFKLFQE